MPATPWITRRAPSLGEHNSDVFGGELGLTARRLARLAAAGVI
jgi:formyl-CoA transferase